MDVAAARAAHLQNIEARAGVSLAALCEAVAGSGLTKHGEVRAWLMERYGLSYGDANAVAHAAAGPPPGSVPAEGDPLSDLYAGKKAELRPIHEAVMAAVSGWGPFEVAPKKAYVSLRRRTQFAMLGPKNAAVVELGLNLKAALPEGRFVAQKPGGMCHYTVALRSVEAVDAEVLDALRAAFDAAG